MFDRCLQWTSNGLGVSSSDLCPACAQDSEHRWYSWFYICSCYLLIANGAVGLGYIVVGPGSILNRWWTSQQILLCSCGGGSLGPLGVQGIDTEPYLLLVTYRLWLVIVGYGYPMAIPRPRYLSISWKNTGPSPRHMLTAFTIVDVISSSIYALPVTSRIVSHFCFWDSYGTQIP